MKVLTEEVDNALDVLEQLLKLEKQKGKKELLGEGKTLVYLQINLFKIPFVASRKRKFLKLRHSLYGDDPEICLFVPNRKTGIEYRQTTEEFIDFCVDHYTEFLEKHKVKGIKTVMPLKQLRAEYGGYELRRKLVQRFDIFLCKNTLLYNSRFLTGLGKVFRVANKEPFGVAFPKQNANYDPQFNENVQRAVFASSFFIKPYSDNYSVPFGTVSNSKLELKENLKTVLEQLLNQDIIPGGFKNIKAMYIWPSQSKTVPLYMSTELPTDLNRPCVKSLGRKPKSVKGELSTQLGKKVTVTAGGNVFVTPTGRRSQKGEPEVESDDEPFNDDSEDEEEGKQDVKAAPRSKYDSSAAKDEESETEDDDEIEEKERKLLKLKREAEREDVDDAEKKRKTEGSPEPENKVGRKGKKKINDRKTLQQQQQNGTVNSRNKKQPTLPGENKVGNKNKGRSNKAEKKLLMKQDKMKKLAKVQRKRTNNKLKQGKKS